MIRSRMSTPSPSSSRPASPSSPTASPAPPIPAIHATAPATASSNLKPDNPGATKRKVRKIARTEAGIVKQASKKAKTGRSFFVLNNRFFFFNFTFV